MAIITETDWQACTSPVEMLEFCQTRQFNRKFPQTPHIPYQGRGRILQDRSLQRKLRLVACGFCRRIWYDLPEGLYRQAIETTERYADGAVGQKQVETVRLMLAPAMLPYEEATQSKIDRAVKNAMRTYQDAEHIGRLFYVALSTAWEIGELESVARDLWKAPTAQWDAYVIGRNSPKNADEQRVRALVLRDVIPSPFRTVEFDPAWRAWRDATVTQVARTIYEEHRLDDLPILADALEEAGCNVPAILDHCRQPALHVRGCWVLDLLLGR